MTNEIATTSQTEEFNLAAFGFSQEDLSEFSGLDMIEASDIRIPYARLIAKKTKEHDVGDIVLPDGKVIKGAKGETLDGFALIHSQKVRVYFPTPFKPTNSFTCRSLNGQQGAPDGQYAGRDCATCDFAKYPEEGGASPCRDQRLLVLTSPDGTPFHLQVAGVGVREWSAFVSGSLQKGLNLASRAYKARIPAACNLQLGVKMVDTDYGPFPAIHFTLAEPNPIFKAERLAQNLEAYKAYKEFLEEHLKTAATQTKMSMVVETGENSDLF